MYERRNDYLKRRADMRRGRRREHPYEDYGTRGNKFYYETPPHPRYYEDRHYGDVEKEYEYDLKEWINKLLKKDRFNIPEHQVIKQAENMGINFNEFTREEFYAVYLMNVSDHPTISNDYNIYIKMAIDFFKDDDIAVSPSEKVCLYLYRIVLGEYDV